MLGWLFFGTMTDFFNKPPVLPKEILKPYHKRNSTGMKGKKMKQKRLKYGATKDMSPEEYKEYKRNLQRNWRKRNKKLVKEHNHDWWVHYKETKPRICICKYCGNEFNAPRNYYKTCPDCRNKPKKYELIKMEKEQRKKERQEMIEEARDWYKAGMTQEEIALDFGVSQKCISNWVKGVKDV